MEEYFAIFLKEVEKKTFEAIESGIKMGLEKYSSQMQKNSMNELLSRKEIAKLLSLSLPSIDKYTKEGVIPSHRIGSSIRYYKSEVENSLLKRNFN